MKNNKFTIVILILLFIILPDLNFVYSSNINQDSPAISQYNSGEKFISLGDTANAIKAFERAVKIDRKFSKAYHRLAQIHLNIGKLDNRRKARNNIEKAVRYEPENISYLTTQLELFYHIRFYHTANSIAKKILKLNKNLPKVYYILGRISEMKWLKYTDMQDKKERNDPSPIDDPIFVYFSDFVKKDLTEAVDYYSQAIASDPTFSAAFYRLAFIFYEKRLFIRMEEILVEGLRVDPDNKDYFLFLGLCYYRTKSIPEVVNAYDKAVNLMQAGERQLFEAIDLVSTPDQGKVYKASNRTEKSELEYRYWKQRDPLFLTEGNERKLEHYGRIAYANLRFSNRLKGVAGWQTAQGDVYIRFGAPLKQTKTWPKIGSTMGKYPVAHSVANWSYPGFSVRFEDINFDGHYRFYNRSEFNDLIKKQPEKYDYSSPDRQLAFSAGFATFMEYGNRSVLEVYQNIPQNEFLTFKQAKFLRRGIFLFDQNWQELLRSVTSDPNFLNYKDSLLVGWERLQVPPGKYFLIVEYMDVDNGKTGQWRKEIQVSDFKNNDLAVSDLITAWEIENLEQENVLQRGGMKIIPNSSAVYPAGSVIPVYFEIYNLAFGENDETNYRITFTVKAGDSERKGSLIRRLFGGGRSPGQIGTSSEYSGTTQSDFIYHTLSLANPEKIEYRLTIEIQDLNTNVKVSKEVTFRLK